MTAPILFIGFDGIEPDLVCDWARAGRLPHFAALLGDSRHGSLQTLPAYGDGATWPSLFTGVAPDRHGRYFARQLKPRSYEPMKPVPELDIAFPPFWKHLSEAGRRVAVLDVPYSPVDPALNGVQVVDWLMHDRYGVPRSTPATLIDDVLARYGDDPFEGNSDDFRHTLEMPQIVERLVNRTNTKCEIALEFLARDRWDLFAVAFTEPHDVGHLAWHLHDPSHPKHDPDWFARHGDPMLASYQALDAALGRLLEAAEPDATVYVFLGLGMGPNFTANGVLDTILCRLEGLPDPIPSRVRRKALRTRFGPIGDILAKVDVRLGRRARTRRRFFALEHNENSGAVRINLAGREPRGRVHPEDYNAVCAELTEAMLDIRNEASGEPLVSRVVPIAGAAPGEARDAMPDLFFVWNRSAPIESITSDRIGRITDISSWGRTGDHTPNAYLLVRGPGIEAGTLPPDTSLLDIGPTVAARGGATMPGVDGRPLDRTHSRFVDG